MTTKVRLKDLSVAWFQGRVERALLGRVMSVLMFSAVALIPVSYPLAGALVQISLSGMFIAAARWS